MRTDYRVRVYVSFDLDVGAESRVDAMMFAEDLTERVVRESFGRAENVVAEAREVQELNGKDVGART